MQKIDRVKLNQMLRAGKSPKEVAKGLRKNNFTFLTAPTCNSNQARFCGE